MLFAFGSEIRPFSFCSHFHKGRGKVISFFFEGKHHKPCIWHATYAYCSLFRQQLPVQAHLHGAAIDIEYNDRIFDLTTPAGFVSLGWLLVMKIRSFESRD